MPLLSKRPHRGLAKTRYSFVVTVERLDFGSSDKLRHNSELSVQWVRGSKMASTSSRPPFNTAATFQREQLTLICTLFSATDSPSAFERKSCTFEAVEKIGGRPRTRGKSPKLDLASYANAPPGEGKPFVVQLSKRGKPTAWLKLTIEGSPLAGGADGSDASSDSAGTLDDLDSNYDSASSVGGSDVARLSDLIGASGLDETPSSADGSSPSRPLQALMPPAAPNPFAEDTDDGGGGAKEQPSTNPFEAPPAVAVGVAVPAAAAARAPPPSPGCSNPFGRPTAAEAQRQCEALRAQLQQARATVEEQARTIEAMRQRERQRSALVPQGAAELAEELAICKEVQRETALEASARAAEAEALKAQLETERREAREARERLARATEKQRSVAARMTDREVKAEARVEAREEELSNAYRSAMEAQERRIAELETELEASRTSK